VYSVYYVYVFRLFLWYVEISKIMTLSIIIVAMIIIVDTIPIIIIDTNNLNRSDRSQ